MLFLSFFAIFSYIFYTRYPVFKNTSLKNGSYFFGFQTDIIASKKN